MESHWEVLGLEQSTASERDVKRAYAKLLKTTRPDKDPEGFQRLREAYDIALMELKYASLPSAFADESAEEGASGEAVGESGQILPDDIGAQSVAQPSWPSDFREAVTELETAVDSGEGVTEAARKFESALYANPQLAPEWGQTVARLLRDDQTSPELKFKAKALLFELEYDSSSGAMAVISRMEREGRRAGITELANLFIQHQDRINSPAGGEAMARLACAAAIWESTSVKMLSNLAYERLPIHLRDNIMEAIEADMRLGKVLRGLPQVWRPFWMTRIREPYREWDWDDVESQAALKHIREAQARTWDGFELVSSILPEEIAATIPKKAKLRTAEPMYGYREKPPPLPPQQPVYGGTPVYQPRPTSSGSGASGWVIGIAIFLLIKVVLLASKCDSGYSGTSTSPPTINHEDFSKSARERLDEMREQGVDNEVLERLRREHPDLFRNRPAGEPSFPNNQPYIPGRGNTPGRPYIPGGNNDPGHPYIPGQPSPNIPGPPTPGFPR